MPKIHPEIHAGGNGSHSVASITHDLTLSPVQQQQQLPPTRGSHARAEAWQSQRLQGDSGTDQLENNTQNLAPAFVQTETAQRTQQNLQPPPVTQFEYHATMAQTQSVSSSRPASRSSSEAEEVFKDCKLHVNFTLYSLPASYSFELRISAMRHTTK